MGDHVGRVGQGLDTAVKHYNNFVGGLESRVSAERPQIQRAGGR